MNHKRQRKLGYDDDPKEARRKEAKAQAAAVKAAAAAGKQIVSRDEAKARGLNRYFTGRPCSKGHISDWYVSGYRCAACVQEKQVAWRSENRERYNASITKYITERAKVDPVFALRLRVRTALADALARGGFKKTSKTATVLGCSWVEFKAHIERQFLPGMTWENRDLWHIDHIVAISEGQTEAEVLSLSHFTNLRPLWAPDNLIKSDQRQFLL